MRSDTRNDLIVAVLFIIVSISVIVGTRDYPVATREVGVRTFPLILAALLGILGVLQAVQAIRAHRKAAGEHPRMAPQIGRRSVVRILTTIAGIALYVAVVNTLGFILTSIVYLAAVSVHFGERRPLMVVAFSVIGVLAVYVLFGVVARVPFPYGPIEELLYTMGIV